MEDYQQVRRLHELEGKSIRAIAQSLGISRPTVRKMLELGAPPGYQRNGPAAQPVLGPYVGVIDQILEADRKVHRKQRHTATRIWKRLKEEYQYAGGVTQVKAYVHEQRKRKMEAFIPLEFPLGTGQVDWGEAQVWLDGELTKVYMFVMTLHYSNDRFVACFPSQKAEWFYEGHRRAFEYFGGVPRLLIYDNLKTAVVGIRCQGERVLNKTFRKFRDHYLFESRFCNVASGNEKGHVENGVKWGRSNLLVPIPTLTLWEEFNGDLARRCAAMRTERVRGHEGTIGERWEEERHHLLPIPRTPPDRFQPQHSTVRSLCLVRFDTNDYSAPCQYAHHPVTIRATLDEVRIFFQDQCIAIHPRSFGMEQAIYEPWHYLPLIEMRPRALDDAAPLKQLELAECFRVLRRRLETTEDIPSKGTRAFIRVLQLLEHHSLQELTRAIERALALGAYDDEAIRNLLLCPPERTPTALDLGGRAHLTMYHFAPPSITAYSTLIERRLS